jgi:HD superfamily phosphohydrolase
VSTRSVRDPVHGTIELGTDEWKAVNTAVFQRLRRIRQLALAQLVYPGATHTRFEHSLGVRHVAERVCSSLARSKKLEDEEVRAVCLAALLHDIGHGPFSHASETALDTLNNKRGVHEEISTFIIENDADLAHALGAEACKEAARLVAGGQTSVLRQIISSATDADKLDYLLRDAHFTGVAYGHYDLDRLLDSMVIHGDVEQMRANTGDTWLAFSLDGIEAVEALLLARHHMRRSVYAHKTVFAADIMISRAITLGVEEEHLPVEAFRVSGGAVDEAFVSAYSKQTDNEVLQALIAVDGDSAAKDLAERLRARQLLKQSVSIPLHQRPELSSTAYDHLKDRAMFGPAKIAELEQDLAKELGLRAHLVALQLDVRKNPTYRTPGAAMESEPTVMLIRRDGTDTTLHRESEIFRESTGLQHEYVYLYTDELDEPTKKKAEGLLWERIQTL